MRDFVADSIMIMVYEAMEEFRIALEGGIDALHEHTRLEVTSGITTSFIVLGNTQ